MPVLVQNVGGNALDILVATFAADGQGLLSPTTTGFIWGQFQNLPGNQQFWPTPHIVATGTDIGYDAFGPSSGTITGLSIHVPHTNPPGGHLPAGSYFDLTGGNFSVPAFRSAVLSGNEDALIALLDTQQWTFSGSTGGDEFRGGRLADVIDGNDGNDSLDGAGGNDNLFGGLGADALIGGDGIDLARYDDANYGNLVIRLDAPNLNTGAAAGDRYGSIEGIVSGAGNDTVVGSGAANLLYGRGGNDALRGLGGVDKLYGEDGNDNLFGGVGADAHNGGAGLDLARYDDANYGNLVIRLDLPNLNTGAAAGDTYSGIEGLVAGAGNDTVAGNASANYLYGRAGNDVLNGLGGSDILYGEGGADRFVFTAPLGASNVDRIMDFQRGVDDILLSRSIFGAIGTKLDAAEFGADANNFIIHNRATGQLFYDANGASGGPAPVLFATVTANTILDINDFVMV